MANVIQRRKRMATTELRMVRWGMGVSPLEHRRNEEILQGAKVEAIAGDTDMLCYQWLVTTDL